MGGGREVQREKKNLDLERKKEIPGHGGVILTLGSEW